MSRPGSRAAGLCRQRCRAREARHIEFGDLGQAVLFGELLSGFWSCLRIVTSLRSNAAWSGVEAPRATMHCRISGMLSSTAYAETVSSVGTSRQPISSWPSLSMKFSNCSPTESCALPHAAGGSTSPPHNRRRPARSCLRLPAHLAAAADRGIWISSPAPSPSSGSAPTARDGRDWRGSPAPASTIACDLGPLMWAIKPTPMRHARSADRRSPEASDNPSNSRSCQTPWRRRQKAALRQ